MISFVVQVLTLIHHSIWYKFSFIGSQQAFSCWHMRNSSPVHAWWFPCKKMGKVVSRGQHLPCKGPGQKHTSSITETKRQWKLTGVCRIAEIWERWLVTVNVTGTGLKRLWLPRAARSSFVLQQPGLGFAPCCSWEASSNPRAAAHQEVPLCFSGPNTFASCYWVGWSSWGL